MAHRTLPGLLAAPTAPARLSGMLYRHTAAVNRQVDTGKWTGKSTGRISAADVSRRRHDGVRRALERAEPTRRGR
jgi:hypothetical protein